MGIAETDTITLPTEYITDKINIVLSKKKKNLENSGLQHSYKLTYTFQDNYQILMLQIEVEDSITQ